MSDTDLVTLFNRIPICELQGLIGDDLLDRIEEILPFFPENKSDPSTSIYRKEVLIDILISFIGQDGLYRKDIRRTILSRCSKTEIERLAKEMKIGLKAGLTFDELVGELSTFKWGNNEKTITFLKHFGLSNEYIPPVSTRKMDEELILAPDSHFKQLKEFQFIVYSDALKFFQNPLQRFIIQMPTGSGKTRTAMEIVCNLIIDNPKKSILWLAHSEELCEQSIECFKDVWSHLGTLDVSIARNFGPHSLNKLNRTSFVVSTFQKMRSQMRKNPQLFSDISNNVSLMVVDEAHMAIAPTYREVIERIWQKSDGIYLMGLTATPGRGQIGIADEANEKLANFFDYNKVQIKCSEGDIFKYLRELDILAAIESSPLISNCNYELTEKDKKYISDNFDYPKELLDRIAGDLIRNVEIIKKLKEECKQGKKILYFGVNLAQARLICATLKYFGYRAEYLDDGTRRERRREIIKEFKDGPLQVICNYGILSTGFDAPKTDVVFIARPTLSVVLYSQMVGRGLRGPAIGGKSVCKIIDVRDNIEAYESPGNVYDYFEGYW